MVTINLWWEIIIHSSFPRLFNYAIEITGTRKEKGIEHLNGLTLGELWSRAAFLLSEAKQATFFSTEGTALKICKSGGVGMIGEKKLPVFSFLKKKKKKGKKLGWEKRERSHGFEHGTSRETAGSSRISLLIRDEAAVPICWGRRSPIALHQTHEHLPLDTAFSFDPMGEAEANKIYAATRLSSRHVGRLTWPWGPPSPTCVLRGCPASSTESPSPSARLNW